MKTEREKMLAGEPYFAGDAELVREREAAHARCHAFNATPGCSEAKLRELFGEEGNWSEGCYIEPPFFCDYGSHLELGREVYLNSGCCVLDGAFVRIGDGAKLGPAVQIYTAGHPLDPVARRSGEEYARKVVLEANVWIGGASTILPGITVGEGSVIGAGSVVTRDIPPGVVAAGNPCRVIRPLDR